jgi:hypothetical protein
MESGDQEQIQDDVDGEFDRADDEWDVGLIEGACRAVDCVFDGRCECREGSYADIGDAGSTHLYRHETSYERRRTHQNADAHDEAQDGLEEDESVGELEPLAERAGAFVADDEIGGARQPFVEDFGDHADVGECVGCHDHAGVDVGNP